MKKFIVIVLLAIISCNPKVKIVEKEKDLKYEITKRQVQFDLIKDSQYDKVYVETSDTTGHRRRSKEMISLQHQIDSLQIKYDGLEIELKKY